MDFNSNFLILKSLFVLLIKLNYLSHLLANYNEIQDKTSLVFLFGYYIWVCHHIHVLVKPTVINVVLMLPIIIAPIHNNSREDGVRWI